MFRETSRVRPDSVATTEPDAASPAAVGGGDKTATDVTFLRFDFALVAVKTVAWSGSDS